MNGNLFTLKILEDSRPDIKKGYFSHKGYKG
jgi:hypothetical protein